MGRLNILVTVAVLMVVGCGDSITMVTAATDASTPDAGAVGDASVSSEASTLSTDAGVDVETSTDGGDAASATCLAGQGRCSQYQHQTCTDGAWGDVSDQTCCTDTTRFAVVDDLTVMDTLTGKKWARKGNWATNSDQYWPNFGCEIGRKASAAEMLGLVIGVGTCAPALDQKAFTLTAETEYRGEGGGCVDMTTGTSKTTCSTPKVGYLCVVD